MRGPLASFCPVVSWVLGAELVVVKYFVWLLVCRIYM